MMFCMRPLTLQGFSSSSPSLRLHVLASCLPVGRVPGNNVQVQGRNQQFLPGRLLADAASWPQQWLLGAQGLDLLLWHLQARLSLSQHCCA